jgi:hypothetical protein
MMATSIELLAIVTMLYIYTTQYGNLWTQGAHEPLKYIQFDRYF